ncbi:putative actin-related protein RO7 [Aspergillus undulatus]|uniref:putative actin-related protein RO7 n=1 Tax=Aspergillus undulatus TaxID=1810928 RepID=UPI003CCDFFB4
MSLRQTQSSKSPPHTPQHQLRSNNNSFASTSSGSTYRVEEDAIIFELGARWLRAGFEGESEPKCILGYGPDESRRAGDYRQWLKGTPVADDTLPLPPAKSDDWTRPYELWGMDLRDVDIGLVEDKIERMFREAYNTYLLTDAGSARLVLVLPSVIPHPLLSSVLTTLFSRWRIPSISLLTSAAMTTAAAGLRSALVVDIGWAETIVSGVYEYREVATKRSTRAMKALIQETGHIFSRLTGGNAQSGTISVPFEFCEEVASRLLWCKPSKGEPTQDPLADIRDKTVSVPSPSTPGSFDIELPFSKLSDPVEKVLFAEGAADCDLDDDEKPISLLVYNTLLSLPPDVRGICMSRMVFTGGGANIAGVRSRILDEVASLVEQYGWSPVRGRVVDQQIQRLKNLKLAKPQHLAPPSEAGQPKAGSETTYDTSYETDYETADEADAAKEATEANEAEVEVDPIEQKLLRTREKDVVTPVQGVLREVESLGPWAGASLVSGLKIRGLVEIEREKYLQHGLAGASRDSDHANNHRDHSIPDRRSLRAGDRSSWTLAGWG